MTGNLTFTKFLAAMEPILAEIYRKVSNIRRTLVGNKIVDHSDVVGATTSSFST